MWDNFLKKRRKARIFVSVHSLTNWISLLFLGVSIYTIYNSIRQGNGRYILSWYYPVFIVAILFKVLSIALKVIYNKITDKGGGIEPYTCTIYSLSFEKIIMNARERTDLHKVEDGWYSCEETGRSQLVSIFSCQERYEEESFSIFQEELYKQVQEDIGQKGLIDYAEEKEEIIFFNAFTYDSMDLKNRIQAPVYPRARFASFAYDVFIDLHARSVYLPYFTNLGPEDKEQYLRIVRFICDSFQPLTNSMD